METDVVVFTCERLPLLIQTLRYLRERTIMPIALTVVDDASAGGNGAYIDLLYQQGWVRQAVHQQKRVGIPANLRTLLPLTKSDPLVFSDDDVLVPKLEPDWLARGQAAMEKYPRVGILALNSPQCNINGKRGPKQPLPDGDVTLCRNVPGTFVFIRRGVLEGGLVPPDKTPSPVHQLCLNAAALGWEVGYLTHVYCQHIGEVSVRNNRNMVKELALVKPVDGETLEPPEAYRG
jgi:hypothetical protein